MVRAMVLAALLSLAFQAAPAPVALQVRVTLLDGGGQASPVARHALLISDNPASAPPRRIVTGVDGTATLRLRPGNYTVESDQPVAFRGQAFSWIQIVDIVAGRDATLELTAGNADVEALTSATAASAAEPDTDPSFLLPQWRDSVVAIWTPTAHASGFLIDAKGLILTHATGIGAATSVEVQLTDAIKVAAVVLETNRMRDLAVLWANPTATGSLKPVPVGCAEAPAPPVGAGQEIWTIGAPLRGAKRLTSGTVILAESTAVLSDLAVPSGSAGGPVFTPDGVLVGVTRMVADEDERRGRSRAAASGAACELLASAQRKIIGAAAPDGSHLPVEPERPFPVPALEEAAKRRAGSLDPYRMSSGDFDIAFITPMLTYGARYQAEQPRGRGRAVSETEAAQTFVRPLLDFSNWSEYVAGFPPVLLVRVTPKLVEGFWTKVARGAAWTQGVSLPSFKHFKTSFERMRAFCGDVEVTPIHPLKLEQRVADREAIYEGLYVFDPGALGPHCGAVRVVLYSGKEPEKGDSRVVEPKAIEQIWQDFAPYRHLNPLNPANPANPGSTR